LHFLFVEIWCCGICNDAVLRICSCGFWNCNGAVLEALNGRDIWQMYNDAVSEALNYQGAIF
jgi:hypothetical protein